MATYRLKNCYVDAVQWHRGVVIEGLEERAPELIYSYSGRHYYLNAKFKYIPDCWMPVDPARDEVLPFAFFEVKAGKRVPADTNDPLVQNYLHHMRVEQLPPAYAVLMIDNSPITVNEGDWIVHDDGGVRVFTDKAFNDRFVCEDKDMA